MDNNQINLVTILTCCVVLASASHTENIQGIPDLCSDATVGTALPDHVIELGKIVAGQNGPAFAFADEHDANNLQTIDIAQNARPIGQPAAGSGANTFNNPTPDGNFVAAQVFIGDDGEREPVVTCLSAPVPVAQYVPADYGPSLQWLQPTVFVQMLGFVSYKQWSWRGWWGPDFDRIRNRDRADLAQRLKGREGKQNARDRGQATDRKGQQEKAGNPNKPVTSNNRLGGGQGLQSNISNLSRTPKSNRNVSNAGGRVRNKPNKSTGRGRRR